MRDDYRDVPLERTTTTDGEIVIDDVNKTVWVHGATHNIKVPSGWKVNQYNALHRAMLSRRSLIGVDKCKTDPIGCIKHIRTVTGAGLADAKHAHDAVKVMAY